MLSPTVTGRPSLYARAQRHTRTADLSPQLYQRHDTKWVLQWLSTRSGSPSQYELPLASIATYPRGLEANGLLPAGYSHRLTPTAVPGEYLAAWVQGAVGSEDVYDRYLRRSALQPVSAWVTCGGR
jgi:hypothetical protein